MGATALAAALVATSVVVWVSPGNPVREAIAEAAGAPAADEYREELNGLLAEVAELKRELAEKDADLDATEAEKAALQQELWTAQGTLDAQAAARGANPPSRSTPLAAPVTAPSKAEIIAPAASYFGMYTEQAPFSWATFDATAAKVGYAPNLVGYFGGWDQSFRPDAVIRAWQHSTLPVLTWESRPINATNDQIDEPEYSLPKIIGDPENGVPGAHDAYLRQYARDIVATGLPLGIRLDHEMNGVWYPWAETDGAGNPINGNRPGDYVKMWRHVHDIFEQEGANSLVVWIWAPNIVNNLPASHKAPGYLESLYPGDDYVDWVGLSGYLRPPYREDNTFTFDYTFGPSLDELRSISSKPILLAEVGASETGGHKVAWVTSFFEGLARPENADVIGFSWFNLAVTSYTEGVRATNDWRIDSRSDSLAAFIEGLTRPGSRFVLTPN